MRHLNRPSRKKHGLRTPWMKNCSPDSPFWYEEKAPWPWPPGTKVFEDITKAEARKWRVAA